MTAPVVIAEGVWGPAFEELGSRLGVRCLPADAGRAELLDAVADARALVIRNRSSVDAELLDRAPRLEVVARAGVGLENIDIDAANELGIVILSPQGANAQSVAEMTLGLALALARHIPTHDRSTRNGGWNRIPGRELAGHTWGIVGAGRTGARVAHLATCFGMSVVAHDPELQAAGVTVAGADFVGMDQLLRRSDVVSLHAPSTPSTRRLVDAEFLAALKPGALLVNVARGDLVDENALAAALLSGHLGGAALDVRDVEPPARGRLEECPNLILTPHVAGITVESQERIADALATDIARVLSGGDATCAVGSVVRSRCTA